MVEKSLSNEEKGIREYLIPFAQLIYDIKEEIENGVNFERSL